MCLVAGADGACNCGTSDGNPPKEVRVFVEAGTKPIYLMKADLNADALEDYLLITEDLAPFFDEDGGEHFPRHLSLLVRNGEDELVNKASNSEVVLDAQSGGMLGDPFQGIQVEDSTFTVILYGGSARRWSYRYQFEYSAEQEDWLLARVDTDSYHVNESSQDSKTFTAPEDFSPISFADFSPDKWKAQLEDAP